MKQAVAVAVCLLVMVGLAACKRDVRLQRVPPLVAGDAGIRVVLTFDRNNALELRLSNVQAPESFGAQYTRYVVWTETAGAPPVNVGQIRVEGGQGRMQTLTPLRRFGVLITVEEKGDARQPGPLAVFHTGKEIEW